MVCTSSKLTVLGLSRGPSGDISLYHTNLVVDVPTVMLSVKGSSSGRIFMNGTNKDLYELEYSNESGWFFGPSTRVQLHNRSSGSMANWMPTIFSSSSQFR